jgi:hypothetical protein
MLKPLSHVEANSTRDFKPKSAFDDLMKRFLGPISIGRASVPGGDKFEWTPPGDSSSEVAFKAYTKKVNPTPNPALNCSLKGSARISIATTVRYSFAL